MTIFISSGAFKSQNVERIIELADEFEVDHIELASGCKYNDGMLEDVRRKRGDPNTYLVHNYFPPPKDPFVLNLASTDEQQRTVSLDHAYNAIDLCVELDCPFYSVHSGFAINLTPDMLGQPQLQVDLQPVDFELALETFKESAIQLSDYAAQRNKDVLFENNVVPPRALRNIKSSPMLMVRADEIVEFFTDLNLPNIGLLLDVGHANVSATSYEFDRIDFVEKTMPFVRAFHLSGNDGREDQNHMFGLTDWFAPFVREHREKPMVIEVYKLSRDEIWRQWEIVDELIS